MGGWSQALPYAGFLLGAWVGAVVFSLGWAANNWSMPEQAPGVIRWLWRTLNHGKTQPDHGPWLADAILLCACHVPAVWMVMPWSPYSLLLRGVSLIFLIASAFWLGYLWWLIRKT
jgi:hypothetical protein